MFGINLMNISDDVIETVLNRKQQLIGYLLINNDC